MSRLCPLGRQRPGHRAHILKADLRANKGQIGAANLNDLPATVPLDGPGNSKRLTSARCGLSSAHSAPPLNEWHRALSDR